MGSYGDLCDDDGLELEHFDDDDRVNVDVDDRVDVGVDDGSDIDVRDGNRDRGVQLPRVP